MHRAEQQAEGHAFNPSRGDAHIVGTDGRRERVERLVLPSTRPVESKRGDHLHRELEHRGFRIGRAEEGIVDRSRRGNRTNEVDLARTQLREDGFHLRRLDGWLEVVEQYVVRMIGRRKKRYVASLEGDDLLQMRPEGREVRVRARLSPRLLTRRDRFGELGDK